MVRILGNSPERVKILDLNDVIYYRQQKEYTDQEYESSRDLKKEIEKGRLSLLEQNEVRKNQIPVTVSEPVLIKQVMSPAINQEDIRKIILDVMEDYKKNNKINPQQGLLPTQWGLKEEVRSAVSEALGNMPATAEVKSIDPQEIKRVMAEVLSEHQMGTNPDLSSILLSMIPLIADAVRQEVMRIQIVASQGIPQRVSPAFVGAEFIPTINIDDMKSNVKGEERIASGGDVLGSLDALKRLKKST